MLQTLTSSRGIITAPHHLAAQAGLSVLRDGGTAIEAMVAAGYRPDLARAMEEPGVTAR